MLLQDWTSNLMFGVVAAIVVVALIAAASFLRR
jgi:hypothetical protein